MFFTFKRNDGALVICRKDAVRFVEPDQDGVILHIDGIGATATKTYDIYGFAEIVAGIGDAAVEADQSA